MTKKTKSTKKKATPKRSGQSRTSGGRYARKSKIERSGRLTLDIIKQNYPLMRPIAYRSRKALLEYEKETGNVAQALSILRPSKKEAAAGSEAMKIPTMKQLESMDWHEQVRIYNRVERFYNSPIRTVASQKDLVYRQTQILRDIGFDTSKMTNEQIRGFFELYHQFVEMKNQHFSYQGEKSGDRTAIIAFKQALDLTKVDPRGNMEEFAEAIGKIQRANDFYSAGNYASAQEEIVDAYEILGWTEEDIKQHGGSFFQQRRNG